MTVEPVQLLDPEIFIPSAESAAKREFWVRLLSWINEGDERALVGPTALVGLYELADQRPDESVISSNDFWTILQKLASRTFRPAQGQRSICERHVKTDYSPALGHVENTDRLIRDIQATGEQPHVALRTLEECWSRQSRDCQDCMRSRLHKLTAPPGHSSELNAMARVWRSACIGEQTVDLKTLRTFSQRMFPNLHFSDSAWKHLNTLSGSPSDNLNALVLHLGVLNDQAQRVWTENVTTPGRQAEMQGLDVVASPESPQTHKNSKAMQRRDFQFGQDVVRCEWHAKLRPDTNRIYFAVLDSGVYIGTIVDHLPT